MEQFADYGLVGLVVAALLGFMAYTWKWLTGRHDALLRDVHDVVSSNTDATTRSAEAVAENTQMLREVKTLLQSLNGRR